MKFAVNVFKCVILFNERQNEILIILWLSTLLRGNLIYVPLVRKRKK